MQEKLEVPTLCRMCDHGCGILVSVENGKPVHIRGNPAHPFNKGWMCVKGKSALDLFYAANRLKTPLIRRGGRLLSTSWDEALGHAAERLQRLKERWGPQALGIYYGEGVGHQEIRYYMKRFANVYGTPNFMSVGAICNAARTFGEVLTLGGLTKPDIANARLVVLWGANPLVSHEPVPPKVIRRLGKSGARLVVIDPRTTETAARADLHLKIRPGTDAVLIAGLLHVILREGLWDRGFTGEWVSGFERLQAEVSSPRYAPEAGAALTGIEPEAVRALAREYARTKPACIFTGNGLEHHPSGVAKTRLLAVLKAVTGNLDVPGGELFTPRPPIKDITSPLPSPEAPAIGAEQFPIFCRARGEAHALSLPRAILDEDPYPIKGLTVTGGNPTLQWPDSRRTREAFEKLEFLMVVDVVDAPESRLADVVLPACTFLERDEHRSNVYLNLPYVTLRQAVVEPLYGLPDQMIWVKLAHAMGYREYFPWKSCIEGIDELLSPMGKTYSEIAADGGIYAYDRRVYRRYEREGFGTPSGKVEIYPKRLEEAGFDPSPVPSLEAERMRAAEADQNDPFPLMLATGGNLLPYTHWQFRYIPRLRKTVPDPFLEIHPETAGLLGVRDGEPVELRTETDVIVVPAMITGAIRPGVVHLAQGWETSNANRLTSNEDADPVSGFPNLKSVRCRVVKRTSSS